MIISAIVAKDKNNLIGIGLKMPWHLPKDFSFFKNTTINHPIIFGRKSFESIGCRPLPKRPHIIVSTNPELLFESKNVNTVTTLEDAISLSKSFQSNEIFICGGGQIYKYALEHNLIDRLYITEVQTTISVPEKNKDDSIFFPKINYDQWDLDSIENYKMDEKNKYDMSFLIFNRK